MIDERGASPIGFGNADNLGVRLQTFGGDGSYRAEIEMLDGDPIFLSIDLRPQEEQRYPPLIVASAYQAGFEAGAAAATAKR